ncbi:hypothetical protein U1Q18_032760, partial [Sarracenia purpurea var. burkii]
VEDEVVIMRQGRVWKKVFLCIVPCHLGKSNSENLLCGLLTKLGLIFGEDEVVSRWCSHVKGAFGFKVCTCHDVFQSTCLDFFIGKL